MPEKHLARRADEDRASERAQLFEPTEDLEVLRRLLRETDPGIEDDSLAVDARGLELIEPAFEEAADLREDAVRVGSHRLHRLGRPPHVHENNRDVGSIEEHRNPTRVSTSGNVIDDIGARLQSPLAYRWVSRVDRDRDVAPFPDAFAHADRPATLLAGGNS